MNTTSKMKQTNHFSSAKKLLLILGSVFFTIVGRLFYVMYINSNVYEVGALSEAITDIELLINEEVYLIVMGMSLQLA